MSSSVFCIEQRQLEIRQTRKWLACGLIGSLGVHGVLALVLGNPQEKPQVTEEAIELLIVEEPKKEIIQKPPSPKPSPQPQKKLTKIAPAPKAVPTPVAESRKTSPVSPRPRVAVQADRTPAPVAPAPVRKTQVKETPSRPLPKQPQPDRAPLPQAETLPPAPPVNRTAPVIDNPPPLQREALRNNSAPPPLTSATANPTAIAPSAPPPVNRSTGVVENTAPSGRESLKNNSAPAPVSEGVGNPTAIAPSAPPMVNRNTGPIANEGGDNSEKRERMRAGIGNSTAPTARNSGTGTPVTASRGTPTRPASKPVASPAREREGITCVANCQPSYPAALNGVEGRATVRVTVDPGGRVVSVTLVGSGNNGEIDRQALLAARQMRFTSPPDGKPGEVKITVNFAVAGSEFDRTARERREQQDRARLAREREKKERQAQLERERQERQRQLQQEQRARQLQLERERLERQRSSDVPPITPEPQPLNTSPTNNETSNETTD